MSLTQIVVVGVILGLLIYDALVGKLGQPTESMVLRDWARNWTILPFCAGFLLGHWFGPRQHVNWSAWGFAIPILAYVLGMDIAWNVFKKGQYPWWRYSLWYALAGIPCGILLWGQDGFWAPF